ncbi:hypothetical protein HHO41_11675 [Bacillus sp. DNRA2]|uniref:hypothetical protein n=1 Tax=Bacillus sp. DNRA2 TaxID=2723053 RepID=UPI00145C65CC|nr:hypothetical protein [Bacillus sp. DNRA2]NMD70954.1 hypothetical protein [Bacillus sp. DNRA2]
MTKKISGWLCFIIALGFFCLQMGYLLLHVKYQIEYVDNRLFYGINILIVIFLALSLFLLLTIKKNGKRFGAAFAILFITLNLVLLFIYDGKIKNVIDISPDFKHVFSLKIERSTGKSVYYRTYYGVFGRAKATLPFETTYSHKVLWLTNDTAAFTYKAKDQTIHQYIGTFGDRGGGNSYYNVGPQLQGTWAGKNVRIDCLPGGLTITQNGKSQAYEWKNIVQFGTLAVVLLENNQAKWTIALAENFKVNTAAITPQTGDIILYKATMDDNKPIVLHPQAVE